MGSLSSTDEYSASTPPNTSPESHWYQCVNATAIKAVIKERDSHLNEKAAFNSSGLINYEITTIIVSK